MALQTLVDELRRDFEDEELGKIVLETLDILCSAKEGEEGIEVQFCEILLKVALKIARKVVVYFMICRMSRMSRYYWI